MDTPTTLCLLLSLLLATTLAQILDLEENEVCRRWWGTEWRCKNIRDCPGAGDVRSRRPMICSFQGKSPVVCCPPSPPGLQLKQSKAVAYCEKIQATCASEKRWRPGGNKWGLNGGKFGVASFGGGRWGAPGGGRWGPGGGGWGSSRGGGGSWENSRGGGGWGNSRGDDWGRGPSTSFHWPPRNKRQVNTYSDEEHRPSIIGGDFSFGRSRPYMALIGFGDPNDKQWNCGGSLISERYVLSAAHCSESKTQGLAKWVLLGELDLSSQNDDARPEEFTIEKRILHPEYKEPAIYNDLVIFKLDREVIFSQWIRPVCLHTMEAITRTRATATGWGRVDFVGDTSAKLMEVELTLVNGEECRSFHASTGPTKLPQGINTQRMLCAGEKEGGKDTCAGDSGGPLVFKEPGKCVYKQIGLTSFGKQCALPNSPGVYTRISYYVPWIESVVWP